MTAASIVRLRIGDEGSGTALRYVEPRDWPEVSVAVGATRISIPTHLPALRFEHDPPRLELRDRAGMPRLRIELPVTVDGDGKGVRLRLHLVGEQHFYGLGQMSGFDRLAAPRRMWNSHVNHASGSDIAIPLLISNAGYGLFFDNSSLSRLEPGDSDSSTWFDYTCSSGSLDLYYLGGDGMRGALDAAADLLGRAPMPPRWSLGYLQSTRHFENADELRRLPAMFRDKRLPCDALFLLSSYGEALGWNRGVGSLDWHEGLASDPATLIARLRDQGFHAITHEYPVLHPESPLFAEANARGFLLVDAYPDTPADARTPVTYTSGQRFIDFSNPEAREWWWSQHRDLVSLGIDGWWLDGGEGPSAESRMHEGTGALQHNRYDLLRYRAFADGEAADRPDARTFLFCRSGGAGMQRHGAGTWTGDINNTFATFEAQVATGLNVGMSGVPYWGTDTGGYYPTVGASGELFARWFQFATFCPIFRAHGRVWREHLPWGYGDEIEAICRRYLELRYRLIPYTYTLAWQAHHRGLPLMRPLVLDYPDDPRTWELGTEFLWGDDLLVAPVTRAGATHWPVYLPAGRWHDFWTHEAYDGPRSVSVEAPLDRLPLFVRAGAIVPMSAVTQHLSGGPPTEVTLVVYPAESASFTLYDDDGTTNAYREGAFALTELSCVAQASALVCRIAPPDDTAAVIPAERSYSFQIFSPTPPRRVQRKAGALMQKGRDEEGPGWWHDGKEFLYVRLGAGPAEVGIDW